jgi:hypothetical protein
MSKKDFDEWYSKGTVFVVPVCLIGTVASVAAPGQESWWGWPFLLGLGVWFFVVPHFRSDI